MLMCYQVVLILLCFSTPLQVLVILELHMNSVKMGELTRFQLGVIGALLISVALSVSIVICNKALISNLGFPFGKRFYFLISLW
ncbi:hypothetical protein HanXRQr2_Chr06g0265161 [Helianthus annuus]|uniref:Uncharacterized protein n=1 Tax=Helianthus annuus TaxID=4232 RepID=A0A9K3ITN3_HELAN|nr:hypothetical protein HanXRQr2_Chr06g0265161 [Helianthus annuus]KAJ0560966.1 hypothetical protein HanHA300_Chr06g0217421 [Helianthus annuus]KAJ0567471.1 hypothetical protein HanIR_Chr06g0285161 [Helianthus annuus]KAJ0574005.1 hypothetical protein HanHA89_Chr06g0233221 [Helianthus annuus]KAJ0738339.1 hypothetical protein HanLR1_Chr06g0217151 [Helianthus annuus]